MGHRFARCHECARFLVVVKQDSTYSSAIKRVSALSVVSCTSQICTGFAYRGRRDKQGFTLKGLLQEETVFIRNTQVSAFVSVV